MFHYIKLPLAYIVEGRRPDGSNASYIYNSNQQSLSSIITQAESNEGVYVCGYINPIQRLAPLLLFWQ